MQLSKIIKNLKNHNQTKKYIFSSIKPNYKKFEEKRYWRGPVWINCNWIIYQGLKNKDKKFANKIKEKTINLIKRNGFFEISKLQSYNDNTHTIDNTLVDQDRDSTANVHTFSFDGSFIRNNLNFYQ